MVYLDTVEEVCGEDGVQDLAHIGMVVPEAGEPFAGVEVEIGATRGVVEVGALRRLVLLVEAEDPQHVDERSIEMAAGQLDRLLYAVSRFRDDAEGVDGGVRRTEDVRNDRGTLRERLLRPPRSHPRCAAR
jgi:hypothetical protein